MIHQSVCVSGASFYLRNQKLGSSSFFTHQTLIAGAVGVANGFNHGKYGNNVHKLGYHPKKWQKTMESGWASLTNWCFGHKQMKHGHRKWRPCFFLGATGMSANKYPLVSLLGCLGWPSIHHMKPILPHMNMAMNWVVLAMFRQPHAWICWTPKKWNMFPENQVS